LKETKSKEERVSLERDIRLEANIRKEIGQTVKMLGVAKTASSKPL